MVQENIFLIVKARITAVEGYRGQKHNQFKD